MPSPKHRTSYGSAARTVYSQPRRPAPIATGSTGWCRSEQTPSCRWRSAPQRPSTARDSVLATGAFVPRRGSRLSSVMKIEGKRDYFYQDCCGPQPFSRVAHCRMQVSAQRHGTRQRFTRVCADVSRDSCSRRWRGVSSCAEVDGVPSTLALGLRVPRKGTRRRATKPPRPKNKPYRSSARWLRGPSKNSI